MTDTTLTDAAVFPEDKGTGLPDTDSADYSSAGHFGLLATHHEGSYVASGMNFTVDQANDEIDVSAGYAFIEVSSVDVQQDTASTYDTTLPDPMVMQVILPSSVTLDADADADSDVYLAIDTANNDDAYIRHGSSVSAPSDPSVQLGTADTSNGDTTRSNDLSVPRYRSVEVLKNSYIGATESDVNSLFTGDITGGSGINFTIKEGESAENSAISISDDNIDPGKLRAYFARGTIDSPAAVQDNDRVAQYDAVARSPNGGWENIGGIRAQVAGTPSGDTVPSRVHLRSTDDNNDTLSALTATKNHNVELRNGTFEHNRVSKSSNFTTSGEGYYSVDTSGGAVTATLATANAIDGLELNIKRNGGSNVSVETEGSETIDGAASQTLGSDDDSLTVVYNSDNSDWEIY